MGSSIKAWAGYGIMLASDDDECAPRHFQAFETEPGATCWEDGLLKNLYGSSEPPVEIWHHYLRGRDKPDYPGQWEIPLLIIGGDGPGTLALTSSSDNPEDMTTFMEKCVSERERWNAIIQDFAERCERAGISLPDKKPHPIMFLNWDDGMLK